MSTLAAQAPGVPILEFTFTATGDCSSAASPAGPGPNGSYQYTAVKAGATDFTIQPSSSAGTPVIGVLQNRPDLTSAPGATVRLNGISKLVVDGAAGAIAIGDSLATDSVGRGVKTTSTGAELIGKALAGSTTQNDIISVFLYPGTRY